MARSPLLDKVEKAKKAPRPKIILETRHRAFPRNKRTWNLQFVRLQRTSRQFRLGMRYAVRRRLLRPWKIKFRTRILERDRVVRVVDSAVVDQLEGVKRRNTVIVKDNARMKSEHVKLQTALNDKYRKDLHAHELAVNNDRLTRAYASLLVAYENTPDATADNATLEKFRNFLPDYRTVAETQPEPDLYKLTMATRYPNNFPLRTYSPNPKLHALNEDPGSPGREEPRKSVKAVVATKLYSKRRTALPGEIERSLASFNRSRHDDLREEEEEEENEAGDDSQCTPTSSKASPDGPFYRSLKSARKTPEQVDRLQEPVDAKAESFSDRTYTFGDSEDEERDHLPRVKSVTPAAVAKTPKKKRTFDALLKSESDLGGRRSVGVRASPRLKAQARRSLQASLGNFLTFDQEDDPGEGTSHDDSQDTRSVQEPSWASTMNDADEEQASIPQISVTAASDDDEEPPSRRPSRAAKSKIQTLKEPSLNKKMRCPTNVEPLSKVKKSSGRPSGRLTKASSEEIILSD